MEFEFLIKGIVIGFSIAAPVGPIGILTINRSLTHGPLAGLATGVGAATADAIYGCVAGFGLTAVSTWLVSFQTWLLLAGGLFLCGMGLATLRKNPPAQGKDQSTPIFKGYAFACLSALFLTLTNPVTIISFMAIFAGLDLGATAGSVTGALSLVLGVFMGSCLWWIILTLGVGQVKQKLTARFQAMINRIAGVVLLIFGAFALVRLVP
jgi:threonine/homoserine/homoserine lactone efflux protein